MIERDAAMELTEEIMREWKGPVWYVSHLIATNPHSVTTPVWLVWNSSQKFQGLSMNDLLLKGPDVLNQIRAVLLQFGKGVYAALCDIRTTLCGWKNVKCTYTDLFVGKQLSKNRKTTPSHELTWETDLQDALHS